MSIMTYSVKKCNKKYKNCKIKNANCKMYNHRPHTGNNQPKIKAGSYSTANM